MKPYKDPNTHKITSLLQITESCPNLIRTLPAMIHDTVNVEDMNTKLEDHGPDASRYGIMELVKKRGNMTDVVDMNEEFARNALQIA